MSVCVSVAGLYSMFIGDSGWWEEGPLVVAHVPQLYCNCIANISNFYQTSPSYWPLIRYLLLCKTTPVEKVTTLHMLYQSHVIIT